MTKINKIGLFVILIIFMIPNISVRANNSPSLWAEEFVYSANNRGVLPYSSMYDFQQNITREEFCKMAIKLYEYITNDIVEIPNENPFLDTSCLEVLKAYQLGIVNGCGKNKFKPNGIVTREQLCTFIYRTIKKANPKISFASKQLTFSDIDDVSKYAKESIDFSYSYGLISGVGDNKLNPKGVSTKEQAIVMVERLCRKLEHIAICNLENNNEIMMDSKNIIKHTVRTKLKNWIIANNINYRGMQYLDYNECLAEVLAMFQFNQHIEVTHSLNYNTWKQLNNDALWNKEKRIVDINNKDLEDLIIQKFNIHKPFECDKIVVVKSLTFDDNNIISLDGIEQFYNITSLDFREISDLNLNNIGRLCLQNIKRLYINNCKVINLSMLKELRSIKDLRLNRINLESIEFLRNIETIESLDIDSNNITDLSSLRDCQNLRTLRARYNNISSLVGLENKTNLVNLNIAYNSIEDLSQIANDLNIEYLYLNNNLIKTIECLGNLKLKELDISKNKIESIRILRTMKNLEKLYVWGIPIKSLKDIENCCELRCLEIPSELSSIEALKKITNLEYIRMHQFKGDITPLLAHKKLKHIDIYDKYFNVILKQKNTLDKIIDNNPGLRLNYFAGNGIEKGDNHDMLEYAFESANKFKGIINDIIEDGMNDYQKTKAVHDYIIRNVDYDKDYYYKGIEKYDNVSPEGVLKDGYAICSGYTRLADILLGMCGVKAKYVGGIVDSSKGRAPHAWNIVKIDGKYLHMDVTWDDEDRGISYNHFLISEEDMIKKGNRVIKYINYEVNLCTLYKGEYFD
ncbi:MAG: leucine-rich repeat domain-containing protein [Vallitalea sp.]|nr:leucine-rich repeat domain-containing protein [Vallitalea sp.]